MWSEEVDRVLAAGDEVLDDTDGGTAPDLSMASMENLRSWRTHCQAAEGTISYLRRIVQGRLDIVTAEMRRRAEGAAPGDLGSLVAELPRILADRPAGRSAAARLPTSIVAPSGLDLSDEIDRAVGISGATSLTGLPDEELRRVADRLAALEGDVSRRRRALLSEIDRLGAELARRYRTGEASIGAPS